MRKDKNYYLVLLKKFAEYLYQSEEQVEIRKVQFCELTERTNKSYFVHICVSAFEDLPLINFGVKDEWYWDPITNGSVRLLDKPELDSISAVFDFFSLHSDVFKHFFCTNSQLKKYGTTIPITNQSTHADIAKNILIYLELQEILKD